MRDGYRWIGIAGSIFSPDIRPERAQPGVSQLHTWYNPETRDYWTSSFANWQPTAPENGRRRGFQHVRFEGYVHNTALAGTLPLYGSFNARAKDYHVSTPALPTTVYISQRERSRSLQDGYTGPGRMGYVLAPRKHEIDPATLSSLGVANTKWRGRNGIVDGSFPIVLMLTEYEDLPLRRTLPELREYMYADNKLSVATFFDEFSRGHMDIVEGQSEEPVQWQDDPDTELDESNFNCIVWSGQPAQIAQLTSLCPSYKKYERGGGPDSYPQRIVSKYVQMIDSRVDFSRYDSNRNGTIDKGEMALMVVVPQPDPTVVDPNRFPVRGAGGGISRGPESYGGCIPVDSVSFCADIFEVGEDSSISLIGHELFHALGTSISHNDIYGSGSSGGASLMAAPSGSGERLKVAHLDGWHKMRLGWTKPHVKVIGKGIPPSSTILSTPTRIAEPDGYEPYVFIDRERGAREMFIAEARLRKGYDSGTLDSGIAVWYAAVDSNRHEDGRNGPNYTLNPFNILKEVNSSSGREWEAGGGLSLWTIGFKDVSGGNAIAQFRGGSRTFLKKQYNERSLNWYNENPMAGHTVTPGPSSGLILRAGNRVGSGGIELEFIPDGDIPFRPRIDRMQTTAAQSIFILHGDFGVLDNGQKLKLILSGGGERDLQVLSWNSAAITFERPSDIPAGWHFLQVMGNPEGTVRGNRFPLGVAEGEGPH